MRLAILLMGAALWLGAAYVLPAPTASAAGCPSPPLTVAELRQLWRNGGGSAGFLGMTNIAARRCYGSNDVTVIAFVDMPDGIGGTSASGIRPFWLSEGGLMLYGSANAIRTGHENDSYTVAYRPRLGDLQQRFARRWVSLTAHFDDPVAQTCRGYGPADADPPTRAQAISMCRSIMVLTSITTTAAPETATQPAPPSSSPAGRDERPVIALAAAALLGSMAWLRRRRPGRR